MRPLSAAAEQQTPSWYDFLALEEHAALEAVQNDSTEWRVRGQNDLQTQDEYLAVPDPTSQRRATLKRLRAAVNVEANLRAKALERINLIQASKSPQSSTKAKERVGHEQVRKPPQRRRKARNHVNRVRATNSQQKPTDAMDQESIRVQRKRGRRAGEKVAAEPNRGKAPHEGRASKQASTKPDRRATAVASFSQREGAR
jgi:hypothetical protein